MDARDEATFEDIVALFRALSGRDPTPQELEDLKKRQAMKAADIFDEIKRWHDINDHVTELRNEAERLRQEKLKDTDTPQRILDRVNELNEVLVAAQRWSWRNR